MKAAMATKPQSQLFRHQALFQARWFHRPILDLPPSPSMEQVFTEETATILPVILKVATFAFIQSETLVMSITSRLRPLFKPI